MLVPVCSENQKSGFWVGIAPAGVPTAGVVDFVAVMTKLGPADASATIHGLLLPVCSGIWVGLASSGGFAAGVVVWDILRGALARPQVSVTLESLWGVSPGMHRDHCVQQR